MKHACLVFTKQEDMLQYYAAVTSDMHKSLLRDSGTKNTSEIKNMSSHAHNDTMTQMRICHVQRVCDFK